MGERHVNWFKANNVSLSLHDALPFCITKLITSFDTEGQTKKGH